MNACACLRFVGRYVERMNVDQLVAEAASLPLEDRKTLIGRLLELGCAGREAEFRRMLAEKIDDQDSTHWVPMADLASHLRPDAGSGC